MTDIKETLATAFGEEPPLRVDRAAIVKSGKRRLMMRNAGAGMAVIAAVAVISVPTLLGGRGGGIGVGGASSSSAPPLTTITSTRTTVTPPSSTVTSEPATPDMRTSMPPATNKPQPPRPVTDARAAELTALLTSSGVLPRDAQYTPIPEGPLGMRVTSDKSGYELAADTATATGSGQLRLSLRMERLMSCGEAVSVPGLQCSEQQVDGKRVIVEDHQHGGDRRLAVTYQHADGTLFQAAATDHTRTGPAGPVPPLTWQQLAKIATLPGVAF